MISKVYSGAINGMSADLIEVEISSSKGLRIFTIVGLPDKAVEESRERVSSAVKSSGFLPPREQRKRILVNLAPADLRKEGSVFDLPIAAGYLTATEQLSVNFEKTLILGELSLGGEVKPAKGIASFCLLAMENNFSRIIVPIENLKEALTVKNLALDKMLEVIGVKNLTQCVKYLSGEKIFSAPPPQKENNNGEEEAEFSWIKGQEKAKRGLEISAAGGHHLFFEGPPGTGKTILAKSIRAIAPELSPEESLEVLKIYSIAGLVDRENPVFKKKPFRSPHHSSSRAAVIGGGNPPKVGEITLAHKGIIFMDEFPEFRRDIAEALRVPLEEGKIGLQRANYRFMMPAKFTLIAAANPCPCGFYFHPEKECSCSASQISAYRRKLSGPIMDRIDIFSWVDSVKFEELNSEEEKKTQIKAKERVEKARKIQEERFRKENISLNSEMSPSHIKKYCPLKGRTGEILKKFVNSGEISARGFHRTIKTARTIADIAGNKEITAENIFEALSYRKKSR